MSSNTEKELQEKIHDVLIGFVEDIEEWQSEIAGTPSKYNMDNLKTIYDKPIGELKSLILEHDSTLKAEYEVDTLKDILVSYRQVTGIDKNLYIEWLQESIEKKLKNPLESLILPNNDNGKDYSQEELDVAVKNARKKAYSRGFDTAKTVYLKKKGITEAEYESKLEEMKHFNYDLGYKVASGKLGAGYEEKVREARIDEVNMAIEHEVRTDQGDAVPYWHFADRLTDLNRIIVPSTQPPKENPYIDKAKSTPEMDNHIMKTYLASQQSPKEGIQ